MDNNDKSIYLTLFIVLVVIVAIIILALVFKDDIFDTGKSLGSKPKEELTKKGYGVYQKAYESPCITTNGKCNTAGVKYISEYCYPNPVTGNGCIDETGTQTYNSRSRNEVCIPTCRSYVLQESTEPYICQYDNPFNSPNYSCVPTNAQSYEYRKYSCIKNDSIGDNTCTYTCGSAGVDSAGIRGDIDPSKESYIPYCQQPKNLGKVITINTLPWNNITSLGQKGFNISKGYNIKNIILSNGLVDPNNFKISPPYPPWSDNPSNIITYSQLRELDTTLTVYQNCITTDIKPYCDNYYYVRPIEIGSDITNERVPELCQLDGGYTQISQCFYHPWYNGPGEGPGAGASGLNFVNPYTKVTKGLTGSAFSWYGIGNYGYFATPLLCEDTVGPLAGVTGNTGDYIIPSQNSGVCMNLSNTPQQCSNDFTNIFPVTPSNNIANLIKELDTGTYNPTIYSSYPATANSTNYICNVDYANGISTHQPGCTQTCQYIPTYEEIDFTAPDINGAFLNSNLQSLLGNYIKFNVEISGQNYFLSTQNAPCKNNSNQNVPLGACNGNTGTSYLPVPCVFIYDGGTGINAGNYWNKIGCDEESIQLSTAMQIIISPSVIYDAYAPGSTGSAILCDLYATVNGVFGYLSVGNTNSNIPDANFGNVNNYLYPSNLGNIVASLYTSNPNDTLYFNPLPRGQEIPRDVNGPNIPYFILTYSGGSYTITSSSFIAPVIASYNGVTYTPTAFTGFNFTTSSSATPGTPYFFTQSFVNPIIKQGGIYSGEDVTRTISLQRNNKCYNYSMCNRGQPTGTVCYPNTCNLFNVYNPDYCN
jgi:hypothetical protein